MEQAKGLPPPVYWEMTSFIRPKTVASMDHRAAVEISRVEAGEDLASIHGEAIKNYMEYKKLICGALRILELAERHPEGAAADLGSGTGVGAAILSRISRISRVYAVEYSENFVLNVMPIVFKCLEAEVQKIQRVVGDFNNILLPDGALDLIVEIGSYHHSEDLALSAKEAFRVLKPGGVIIAIDRAWPDDTPLEELNAKLEKELPVPLKQKYGIPEHQSFTRRDFGEHEYLRSHWENVFSAVGFDTFVLMQDHSKIPGMNFLFSVLKLPVFDWSIQRAARGYKNGKKRATIYGWNKQRHVFIFVKPKNGRD